MRSFCLLSILFFLAAALQASTGRKREVKQPCFIVSDARDLEVERIVLSESRTRFDVIFYGFPGDSVVFSPDIVLHTPEADYALSGAESDSEDDGRHVGRFPSSGKQGVSFFFPALPASLHEVDLVDKDNRRTIRGIQLTNAEPYVYVPSFLLEKKTPLCLALPEQKPQSARNILNGYILGYKDGMSLPVTFHTPEPLTGGERVRSVKIRPDGSFHIETTLLMSGGAKLQIGQASLDLFLTPGEMTAYIHLPRLSMSASRLLRHRYEDVQKAWFDGGEEALNTELATWKYSFAEKSLGAGLEKTRGSFGQNLPELEEDFAEVLIGALRRDKHVGAGYRMYMETNLEMSALVAEGKRGEMSHTMPSATLRYGYDYADYLRFAERDRKQTLDLWPELKKAQEVFERVLRSGKMESADRKAYHSIASPEIRDYVKKRLIEVWAEHERARSAKGSVISEVPSTLGGEELLPALISPFSGHPVLIDLWATWCAPCRRSLKAVRPLKENPALSETVYLYITGPSSPLAEWKEEAAGISGIHFRLTEEQWEYVCRSCQINGIPAYLVFDSTGKLQKRFIGFPGADALQKELLRAGE